MNVRKIRIKAKLIQETDHDLIICPEATDDRNLIISKDLIIKSFEKDFFSRNNLVNTWTTFHIDSFFFKDKDSLRKVRRLKNAGHLFIYGVKQFGIDFDAVIDRVYSRSMDHCFYCDEILDRTNRTSEHLVPKAMLKAYLIVTLDDNTVPCCSDCNSEKANLHPYTFREYVKFKVDVAPRYKKMLRTLNNILISKKDPLS